MKLNLLLITLILIFLSATGLNAAVVTEADREKLLNGSLTGEALENDYQTFVNKLETKKQTRLRRADIYADHIDKIGVKRIADYLESENPSCHGVGHALGHLIGKKIPELSAAMQICGSTCTYSCVHGVFKVYFENLGKAYHEHDGSHGGSHDHSNKNNKMKMAAKPVVFTPDEEAKFSRDVNAACNKSTSMVADFFKGNCAHGVGHAMGKLGTTIRKGTEYCKMFEKKDMQYYCETGVFMELGSGLTEKLYKGVRRRSEEIKIALKFCGENSENPSGCLRFFLPRNKSLGQITRFAVLCNKQETHLKNHCFNALGFQSRAYIAKNPRDMEYACSVADGPAKNACISGVAFMKKGQRLRAMIKDACEYLSNDSEKSVCLDQSSKYYYDLDNAELNSIL